ncbi:DUF72 domain-containing protein [Pedobacter jejuensis]|uniref:DUF72 domain-containing protein n=1 Tax=Pedobacter jejuensis TaxID=1268550 RepID=A0A3N0C0N1_9SPHI|nr:DUF72 domain-containing protein [Pedobacter jejuensis]RNL55755.1 DUF72 domain-containing protein [Pedobacter jejuensis]
MDNSVTHYYSGTSGLLLPVPNKTYYPIEFQNRSRLCYYSSLLNSIEINSSFYKIPQPATIKKWFAEVSDDFKFTFKLFKGITHQPGLNFDEAELSKFFDVIANVAHKKGCVLVQFPPSVRIAHFAQLQNLMASLRNYDPSNEWKIALEFRHTSLYTEEITELLTEFNLASVIHDKSNASSPMHLDESPFVYLRFHGPGGDYKGSYSDALLAEYASYITDWIDEGKTVFTYFNNTMGDAHGNLKMLQNMINENR